MQRVMELKRRREAMIHYPHHHLPKDPYQPYESEFAAPIWDQDRGMLGALLREVTLAEGCLR